MYVTGHRCEYLSEVRSIAVILTCFNRKDTTLADRKSTRLNSSHTVNSYAVFCLKKKN